MPDAVAHQGLAALDDRARPSYDRGVAEQMVGLGAHVGAMTPGELAATIYHHMGVPLNATYLDQAGRPRRVLGEDEPLAELG